MQPALAPAPHPGHNIPQENAVESNLREQLLAQVVGPPPPSHHPHGPPPGMENMRPSNSASPGDHNIDPAIAGSVPGPVPIPVPVPGPVIPVSASNNNLNNASAESGAEDTHGEGSGRKASKRELSTSKRAAQNRAAQRAFRQRKEGYIKKLEEQVRDLHTLEENYKAVQAENYQLRDYIINLQSRLIESQGEYPQPPSNIDLPPPRQDPSTMPSQLAAPTAPMVSSTDQTSHLQASAVQAQAVAEMGNGNASGNTKHPHEDPVAVIQQQQQQQQHQHQQHLAAAAAAAAAGNGYPSKRIKSRGEMEMDIPTRPTTDVSHTPIPGAMMMRAGGTRNIPMP